MTNTQITRGRRALALAVVVTAIGPAALLSAAGSARPTGPGAVCAAYDASASPTRVNLDALLAARLRAGCSSTGQEPAVTPTRVNLDALLAARLG